MNRVAVSGASGFMAGYLIQRLIADGKSIVALGRSERSLSKMPQSVDTRVTQYGEDLVDHLSDVDTLFHLAARRTTSEDGAFNIAPFVESAASMLDALLAACRTRKVKKIVHASSIAVYSGANAHPYVETEIAEPAGPYGLMKLHCEQVCDYWSRQTGIPVAHARIAQCYGYGEKLTPALMSLANRARLGKQLVVKDGGLYPIDEVYVEDVADALLSMATQNAGGAFNIGSGCGYSVREIAETANSVFENPLDVIVEPISANARPSTPRHMDITKAQKILGWSPKHSLREGLIAMKLNSQ